MYSFGLPIGEEIITLTFVCFDTIPECDRQMNISAVAIPVLA